MERNSYLTKNEMEIQREKWISEVSTATSTFEVEDVIAKKLEENPGWDEPFFVGYLDLVLEKYKIWRKELPSVEIFYAVKANDDPVLLKLLVALGVSFDCSSKGEIMAISKLGVSANKIMFSNPYKLPSHLTYALSIGVTWMAIDSMDELNKIHSLCPTAKLVIRLNPRKETTAYPAMSVKFGCNYLEAKNLLQEAKKKDMNVSGISFYVGHCTDSPVPYVDAIELAKEIVLEARNMGHNVRVLDIGGGFQGPKDKENLFTEVAAAIRQSLDEFVPPEMGFRFIGEPGQFLGIRAFEVYAKVIGVRLRRSEQGELCQYVILSAGHYSCLNHLTFKYNKTNIAVLKSFDGDNQSNHSVKSVFWGPTCDPMDILLSINFQPLKRGMWLKCSNLGAYTKTLMTNYNGFSMTPTKYFLGPKTKEIIISHFKHL